MEMEISSTSNRNASILPSVMSNSHHIFKTRSKKSNKFPRQPNITNTLSDPIKCSHPAKKSREPANMHMHQIQFILQNDKMRNQMNYIHTLSSGCDRSKKRLGNTPASRTARTPASKPQAKLPRAAAD